MRGAFVVHSQVVANIMAECSQGDPIRELRALDRGERLPKRRFNPDSDVVYAGISGLDVQEASELVPGIGIRPVYVDVFSCPIAAFAPPPGPRQPHPAHWTAVEGGFSFDVRSEISFIRTDCIEGLSQTQIVWLLSAVLRLWVSRPVRTVFVANMPLDELGPAGNRGRALTFESQPGQTGAWQQKITPLTTNQVHDVGRALRSTASLLRHERFERAFTIYDQVNWSGGLGAGSLLLWTAIEAVFGLGQGLNMGKRLAAAVSDYVASDRPERDRLYPIIRDAYRRRGRLVHAGTAIDPEGFTEAARIGRAIFRRAITSGDLPRIDGDRRSSRAPPHYPLGTTT